MTTSAFSAQPLSPIRNEAQQEPRQGGGRRMGQYTKPITQIIPLQFSLLFREAGEAAPLISSFHNEQTQKLWVSSQAGVVFYQLGDTSVNPCECTRELIPLVTANTLKIFQERQEHSSAVMSSAKQPQ